MVEADDDGHAGGSTATDVPLPDADSPLPNYPLAEQKGAESLSGSNQERSPDAPSTVVPQSEERTAQIIAHYELKEELGRGGVGRVIRAWDKKLDRDVVLKIPFVRPAFARFAREAAITARLEHPSIVPVHAVGEFRDGTPFYVMKLLEGRSLRDEFAAAHSLSERLALLPIMIAVCDAMAYAHSKRVIHRDLKPRNVIVGTFGETTVIDWGMAKRIESIDERGELVDTEFSFEGNDQTRAGAIIGTPAYMPPEQARGERVDKRADVYALGTMLYHLFSGEYPYIGKGSTEILREVVEGPPRPIEALEPRLPIELAAIVRRAMSREASQRYASAGELAEDLRRYQTGRLVAAHAYSTSQLLRRWFWKYRAPVVVAAIASALLVVFGALSFHRIVAERRRAEEQRAAAEELVDFMLVDLRTRLRQVGKLALLDGVASKVDKYYERVQATWDELSGNQLGRKADTLGIIADVRDGQGNLAIALEARKRAIQLARKLVASEPHVEERAHQLVHILRASMKQWTDMGNLDEAQSAADEAIRLINKEMVSTLDPESWLFDRAAILSMLGYVETQRGNAEKSIALYLEATAIEERLMIVAPDSEDVAFDMTTSLTQLAKELSSTGRYGKAIVRAGRSDEVATRFARLDTSNVEWQLRLARAKSEVGTSLQDLGRFDTAIKYFEAARDIRGRLTVRDPENLTWRLSVVQSDALLADAQQKNGELDKARRTAAEATDLMEGLAAREPTKRQFVEWLYFVYIKAAGIEQRLDSEAALKYYLKARDVMEPLASRKDNSSAREWLALALISVSEEQLKHGANQETIPGLNRAIGILDVRLHEEPTMRANLLNLAGAHALLGEALVQEGDIDGGLRHLARSCGLYDVVIAEMGDATVHLDAARHHARMGALLAEYKRSPMAARLGYERARAILKKLDGENRLPADGRKDLEAIDRALR